MAHIDNLIDSIKDPQLRTALRTEYDKVTKKRRVGLVFDRHLPESVALPGFTIREGEKVQVLADGSEDPAELDGSGVWTVTDVSATHTQLRDGNGETRQVASDRLVATRQFGDPIYPGLMSTGRIVRGSGADGDADGKPFHTVINAENYHALEALLFAHEGQVDAIYIDPPYNTGARDWKYNNDYVDDADPYRHSKWLSFLERRLLLAKRLLNPADSVLIVTIDEKEYLRLGLLLEQVFATANIQMISSVINPKGSARGQGFRRTDEYLFMVMLGDAAPARLPLGSEWSSAAGQLEPDEDDTEAPSQTPDWTSIMRRGSASARADRPGMFFPIYVDPAGPQIVHVGEPLPSDEHTAPELPGLVAVLPIRSNGAEGRWQVSPGELRSRLEQGRVRLGRKTNYGYVVNYLPDGAYAAVMSDRFTIEGRAEDGSLIAVGVRDTRRVAPTQWKVASHNASEQGTGLLRRFLPERKFPFPKSLYAVEDALRFFVANKPDALILDFFAGSGTTTHAVMRLNHQDGGRRRSICVTNNEVGIVEQATLRARGLKPGDEQWEALGICDYITKPRIRAAITGTTSTGTAVAGDYRFVDEFPMADGFQENAEFFTLTYEDPTLVSLGRRFEAIAPLLWLRAGARGDRIADVSEKGWSIPPSACYGVLFDTSAWGAFVTAAARRDDLTHAFIVTDSLVEYQQIVARLDPGLATTRLYADYLRSFEINVRTT